METVQLPVWLDPARIDADMPPETRSALGLDPTSLEYTETSGSREIPLDYRAFRSVHCQAEIDATRETMFQLTANATTPRIERMLGCRQHAHFYRQKSTGTVKVLAAACRDRWCVFCAQARAGEIGEQIAAWLPTVKRPRFVTFTLRSSNAPLSHQINSMYNAFRAFRKDPLTAAAVRAGVWCFQVTYNPERKQWHPHLHCLLVGTWHEQGWWSDQWKRITKGSYVVDLRSVRQGKREAQYVARYAARPVNLRDLPAEVRAEAVNAFHGRRLFGMWGKPPERPEIKKTPLDMNDWEWLASWREIVEQRQTDINAATIWQAWREKLALAPALVPPNPLLECDTRPKPPPPAPRPQAGLFPTETGFHVYPIGDRT